MSIKIKKQLVPSKLRKVYAGTNARRYITIHETANRGRGADAQAHANLQSRGNPGVSNSWHYQVDDRQVIQSYPDTARAWHSGGGRDAGNLSSIAIEICVNSDGNYDKALANAAALVRQLRKKYNIPARRVVQHHYWSGKNCPTILRSRGGGWAAFVAATDPKSKAAPKPKPAPKPKAKAGGKVWPSVALPSGGKHTTASHNAWVKLLTDVGHLRKRESLTKGFQRWLRFLGYNVGPVDGVFGPRTARALQEFLADRGFYRGRIDGDRGPVTIRAEIAYLNSQRTYY